MSKQPKVLLVHPGIQHAPRLAEQLERQGMLARFWTGWAKAEAGSGKRSVAIHGDKLKTRRWLEWVALLLNRAGMDSERVWHWRNLTFQKMIPDGEIQAADIVIGFDTSSWIIAQRSKKRGKTFILEQSVIDPDAKVKALRKMADQYPDWAEEAKPRARWLALAERQEHKLADKISVASDYVKKSFIESGVHADKITINPYGVSPFFLSSVDFLTRTLNLDECKFIFAGHVSGRKGMPVLLEAWGNKNIPRGSLTIAGSLAQWPSSVSKPSGVDFKGSLSKQALRNVFLASDVFVLPSYAEGLPIVALEAMATGLPVISTHVLEGVIKDGKNGWLIESSDMRGLRERLLWCSRNMRKMSEMGEAARQTAKEYTWEAYGHRYLKILKLLIRPR